MGPKSRAVVLLSGGMDSSSIVCMADRVLSCGMAQTPRLDTVSYYDDAEPNWDESAYFKVVERRRGRTGLHLPLNFRKNLRPTFPTDCFAATPGSGSGFEENDLYLAYLRSGQYRVLLQGFGGDEVLGGIPAPALDLADLLVTVDPGTPVLIVLEDLHWADALSLDVLGHLAGRLATRPVLVVGAYRSDELYPALPMRELRARLVGQRLAEEIRLPRLRLDQTATMTSAILGRPAPAQVVAAIYERSDGIPLHVEELLAAIDEDALTLQSGAAVQSAAVPDTLGDAVLSRARQLATCTREVASAAAVIGRSVDFDLLTAIADAGPDEVAGALRELQDAYFVLPGSDAVSFDFRHALIRDALYADTDLPVRRRLHERAARTAAERGYRGAFVSAHFEQAGCPGPAYEHAVAAAGEAASMSAHGEALELYRRAVRNLPGGLPAQDRAVLFAALGDEAAATDDNKAAAGAYRTAHELATGAGDVRAAAALVPRMVAVAHLLGEGLDTRLRALQAALDSLDGVAGADWERARLHSAMAAAYMLDRRLDEAIRYGELSHAESQRTGDDKAALNAATTLGSVLVFAGRMDEGWQLLEDAIARGRGTQQEAEAARGYRMIGSSASVLVEYGRAERWLIEGIRYAENVELWNNRHYMASHLAHVRWATGHHPDHRAVRPRLSGDGARRLGHRQQVHAGGSRSG